MQAGSRNPSWHVPGMLHAFGVGKCFKEQGFHVEQGSVPPPAQVQELPKALRASWVRASHPEQREILPATLGANDALGKQNSPSEFQPKKRGWEEDEEGEGTALPRAAWWDRNSSCLWWCWDTGHNRVLRHWQLLPQSRGHLAELLWGHQRGEESLGREAGVRSTWCVESTHREPCWASPWSTSSTLPQKNLTCVMEEVFTNLQSPEGENYCMSNNKHLNST